MKKTLSIFLTLIMLLSSVATTSVAYSADKTNISTRLEQIANTDGFVPGKTAIVQYNCYGFVAEICNLLFGKTYNGEGIYDNYKAKHSAGYYYTVKTYTTKKTYPDSAFVEDIIKFFTTYARAGDVVHYGAYNSGYKKTHTVLVYSIDSKKMQIMHSNYGSQNVRLDTINWSSFRKNPTSTTDGSLNGWLYATMRLSGAGGIGISINRYSKYDEMFFTDAVGNVENLEPVIELGQVTSVNVTSNENEKIGISWSAVEGATKYVIQIKNTTKNTYFDKTVSSTSTTLNNLTKGNTYQIEIRGICDNGESKQLSPVLTVTTGDGNLPFVDVNIEPLPNVTGLKLAKGTKNKLDFKWNAVPNATQYEVVFKNETANKKSSHIVGENKISFTGLSNGYVFSVKVRAMINGMWTNYTSVKKVATNPNTPTISPLKAVGKLKIKVSWKKPSKNLSGYEIYWSKDKNFKKVIAKTNVGNSKTLTYTGKNFTKGKRYYVKVRAYTKVGSTKYYSSWSKTVSVVCK